MGAFFVYIIKSGFALAVFYIFYRLLVSKHTFHRFNRIVLLSMVLLAGLLPFYPIYNLIGGTEAVTENEIGEFLFSPEEVFITPIQGENAVSAVIPALSYSVWKGLFVFYLAGMISVLLQTFFSFYRLIRIIRKGEIICRETAYKLILTDQPVAPFSWMNYVIISRNDWKEHGQEVLLHEQGHRRAGHSWDLLFSQLFVILHWFNPAIWLIKRELQNIHEFEADQYVLNEGIEAKLYQLLLIRKAVSPQRFLAMTNSFNHSKLKKRIIMMLRKKTTPWAYLKYIYILPLSVIIIAAWSCSEVSEKLSELSEKEFNETDSGMDFYVDLSSYNITTDEWFLEDFYLISRKGTSLFIENAKMWNDEDDYIISSRRILFGEEPDLDSERDKLKYINLINPPQKSGYWQELQEEASFIINGDSAIIYIFTSLEPITMKMDEEDHYSVYKMCWKEDNKENKIDLYFNEQGMEKLTMSPSLPGMFIPSREDMDRNNDYSPFYHRDTF